jgi:hypothetical protein
MHIDFCMEKEGKRPIKGPRLTWGDDIKTDLREIGWGGIDWIHLA